MRGRLKQNRRRTREQRTLRLFFAGAACAAVLIFCGVSLVSYLSDARRAASGQKMFQELYYAEESPAAPPAGLTRGRRPVRREFAAPMPSAANAAADAAVSGGDVEEARAAYREKQEALAALAARVNEAEESALPLMKDVTDEILRKYRSGTSFDSLIAEYGQEAGEEAGRELLFHPDSEQWAETFRQQVMALKKPGEVSEPFITSLGIHIVLYQADWPGGEHTLTAEERQALEASALQAKQTSALRLLEETWKRQYVIETHPELLIP